VRFVALAVASISVLGVPSVALAYRRATVSDAPDRGLFWEDRAIAIELASASLSVPPTDLRAAFGRSLATWTAPACSDLALTDAGEALGITTNLGGGPADGHNRVVLRETGWPEDVGVETLALTSLVYDRDTGRLLDVDVDLNGEAHTFTAGDLVLPDDDDVENTLTHELGHLIGFAHVLDPDATMFGQADTGETIKRDLADDDARALCETYPTGLPTPVIVLEMPPPSGCAASPGRASSRAAIVILLALTARGVRRSRRRARAVGTAS
jgi:hypothetical protein